MLRIAVCDDESNALDAVYSMVCCSLDEYGYDYHVDKYDRGKTLLIEFSNKAYDVVFLDIDMQGMDGFEIAKAIRDEYEECFIIFVTNHSELVYRSFEFQPFHFLRKNCDVALSISVKQVVDKLTYSMKQTRQKKFTDITGRSKVIMIKSILYIQSIRHYANIYYFDNDKSIESVQQRINFSSIIDEFSDLDFIQTHRSYIINLRYVSFIDIAANEIVLKGNIRIPISKQFKKAVNEKYMMYKRKTV